VSYDVNVQIVPASKYNGFGFYSFGQTRSLGVRGINKLVNEVAKCLLTPVGTDPLDPTYGTQLTNLMGANVTTQDAQEVLQLSIQQASDTLTAYQAAQTNVPSDEQLSSIVVTQYILIPEAPGIAAQILITNAANQGLNLILPMLSVTGT
jgi:DNA-binding transcriptional MocR family regulator